MFYVYAHQKQKQQRVTSFIFLAHVSSYNIPTKLESGVCLCLWNRLQWKHFISSHPGKSKISFLGEITIVIYEHKF